MRVDNRIAKPGEIRKVVLSPAFVKVLFYNDNKKELIYTNTTTSYYTVDGNKDELLISI